MSPEITSPNPPIAPTDNSDYSQWSPEANKVERSFTDDASRMIARAEGKYQDPTERAMLAREFIGKIAEATNKGLIVSSVDGLPYDKSIIDSQFDKLSRQLSGRPGKGEEKMANPLSLIPNSLELRNAFREILTGSEAMAGPFAEVLEEDRLERLRKIKEARSVGKQALAASEVKSSELITEIPKSILNSGGSELEPALRGSSYSVEELAPATSRELMEKLTDGFSENDVDSLYRFARSRMNRLQAQKAGDDSLSTVYYRQMNADLNAMPAQVRAVSTQFAGYFDRL